MKRSIQSVAHILIFVAVQVLALHAAAASTNPDKPPKPERGKGWYVMVLWEPGTPIPGSDGTKLIKKVKEPDLEKLGGKVLRSKDSVRFIELPVTAARELRQHESVAILQRLWAGEPLEELKEEPYPARSRSGLETESDTNLDWGPKDYTYDGSGNIKTIGTAAAPDSYAYDTAGRLIQATVGGKTETFKYDAFGNLIEKTVAGANPEVVPVDGSSNRMIGASYDAAGNVTTRKGAEAYQYDSFNMLTVMPRGGRYNLYDANDERVGLIDDNMSRWWLRDLGGQVIREYASETSTNPNFDPVWVWQHDYVYAGGQLVGGEKVQWSYFDPGGGAVYGGKRHYHLDHLGSVRVVTDDDGRSVSEHDYYAFGVTPTKAFQEELETTWVAIDSMRYAGHQRDFLGWHNIENRDYLDYMHARFYDPNLGRFLSVDPGKDWDMRQPQSWNMYSYVRNNPVNRIDPSGMKMECTTNAEGWEECTVIPDAPEEPVAPPPPDPSSMEWLSQRWNSAAIEAGNLKYLSWRDAPILREKRDVPCKSYGERFLQSAIDTNMLPGLAAPTGLGMLTAGKTAQTVGGITLGQWARAGFGGAALRGASFTAAETGLVAGATAVTNFALVTVAYEGGVAIGSAINAGLTDGCE